MFLGTLCDVHKRASASGGSLESLGSVCVCTEWPLQSFCGGVEHAGALYEASNKLIELLYLAGKYFLGPQP